MDRRSYGEEKEREKDRPLNLSTNPSPDTEGKKREEKGPKKRKTKGVSDQCTPDNSGETKWWEVQSPRGQTAQSSTLTIPFLFIIPSNQLLCCLLKKGQVLFSPDQRPTVRPLISRHPHHAAAAACVYLCVCVFMRVCVYVCVYSGFIT